MRIGERGNWQQDGLNDRVRRVADHVENSVAGTIGAGDEVVTRGRMVPDFISAADRDVVRDLHICKVGAERIHR